MRPPLRILLLFLAPFLAHCATVTQIPPTSGMGSTAQTGIATALDRNLALDPRLIHGKKVSLDVEMMGAAPVSSAIVSYARSVLREQVERAGGAVVSEGELFIYAKIDAAGIASTSRALSIRTGTSVSIPFWYSESLKGKSHVTLIYQDAEGNALRTVVNQVEIPHQDIYLFYFFGLPEAP
ncbi:MAG: hypothetical protein EPO39_14515 [Candidatus Manganitrophaceae bacterium]|nr:MAG: hypothetical protein EPO39_14515 [Candidatus Manganitrophaceae bacterium]